MTAEFSILATTNQNRQVFHHPTVNASGHRRTSARALVASCCCWSTMGVSVYAVQYGMSSSDVIVCSRSLARAAQLLASSTRKWRCMFSTSTGGRLGAAARLGVV